jgi:hypothetical protein
MASDDWVREWPRCLLLFELASRYTASGRSHGCARLKSRLEEARVRMEEAPGLVHTLLSELCYVSWLLRKGDLTAARHHLEEAGRKARDVGRLLQSLRYAEARSQGSRLRQRSRQLQERSHELLARSSRLLTRSLALRGKVRPLAIREEEPRPALSRRAHA